MGIEDPVTGEYHWDYDSVEGAQLAYLRRNLELGSCLGLRNNLQRYRERLEASESPAVRSAIAGIVAEAEKAFAIEAEHGIGSLLNLDHPTVQGWIETSNKRPKPIIPHSIIRAAERYRDLHRPEAACHSP